ncbi:hypothetical protein HMPREF1555_00523 [Porphyromonas gingivalis F0570]|uniref:Uncharacterized protein n=1 Tax=Porphyromonas gingivalis F0570 TaxID=1227271 RepID=A0A0E2M783_PORGN|nr:hypothetical protein HMPREF1555_00523 [Porphyromonas gingivalis F0570]
MHFAPIHKEASAKNRSVVSARGFFFFSFHCSLTAESKQKKKETVPSILSSPFRKEDQEHVLLYPNWFRLQNFPVCYSSKRGS